MGKFFFLLLFSQVTFIFIKYLSPALVGGDGTYHHGNRLVWVSWEQETLCVSIVVTVLWTPPCPHGPC